MQHSEKKNLSLWPRRLFRHTFKLGKMIGTEIHKRFYLSTEHAYLQISDEGCNRIRCDIVEKMLMWALYYTLLIFANTPHSHHSKPKQPMESPVACKPFQSRPPAEAGN